MELPQGKCTVGASTRCQVPLTVAGVQPLHCLIVHGPNKTTVTRWAAGALLNGKEFSTADFRPGDLLQIGEARLQLLATSPAAAVPPPDDYSEAPATTFSPESSTSPQQRPDANQTDRKRCRRLIQALRELRTDTASFKHQIDGLQHQLQEAQRERDRLCEKLDSLETHAGKQQQSSVEIDRLVAELSAACERCNAAESNQAELQSQVQQLQNERERLVAGTETSRQRQHSMEEAIQLRDQRIEQLQKELEEWQFSTRQAEEQIAQQRDQAARWETEREELLASRSDHQLREQKWEQARVAYGEQLTQLENQLDAVRATLDEAHQQGAHKEAETAQLQQQIESLKAERDQLLAERGAYEQQQQESQESLADRDRQIAQLKAEQQGIYDTLQSVEQGAFEQVDACARLQTQLNQIQSERDQLAEAFSLQQQQVAELETTLSERDHLIEQLGEEIDRAIEQREQIDQLKEQLAAEEETIRALRSQKEELSSEKQSWGEQNGEQENRFAELTAELEQARASLAARTEEKQRLEALCEQSRAELDSGRPQLEQLQQQVEVLEHEKTALHAQIQNQAAHAEELLAELQRSRDLVTQRTQELESLQHHYEQLQRQGEGSSPEPPVAEQREMAEADGNSLEETAEASVTASDAETEANAAECFSPVSDFGHPPPGDQQGPSGEDAGEKLFESPESSTEAAGTSVKWWIEDDKEERDAATEFPAESNQADPAKAEALFAAQKDEASEEFQPPSFIEQYAAKFEEDGPSAIPPIEPPTEPTAARAQRDSELFTEEESDDDALAAYMANMMRRVRGETNVELPTPVAEEQSTEDEENEEALLAVQEISRRMTTPGVVDSSSEQQQYAPDSAAVDQPKRTRESQQPIDLTAMRNLANTSARSAIANHSKRRHLESAFTKFLICLIATVAAVSLLLISSSFRDLWFIGGCVAGGVAITWGMKLLGHLLASIREASRLRVTPVELDVEEEPLPIGGSDSAS